MAVSAEQLARELRAFDGRRGIVKALRRSLTRESKPAVAATRAHALAILPKSGGLGAWVAAARIGWKISYAGRTAGVRLKGGRRSLTDRSDLRAIDRGRVRRPSWGRRTRGNWHNQTVSPGWWTDPLSADTRWSGEAERQVDAVLDEIRG